MRRVLVPSLAQFLELTGDPDPYDDSLVLMDCIIAKCKDDDVADGDEPYYYRLIHTSLNPLAL